jgi:threonylcarbamoyladenosine tRNA methylthiotransferase MtaB
VTILTTDTGNIKIAFYTLGCKLNFAETSMISRKFMEKGYKKVGIDSRADIFIINTCTVTQVADKKCRQAIKKVVGNGAKVVVIGCYSQLKPEEISSIDGVDLILGNQEKFNVVEHVEKLLKGTSEKIITGNVGEIRHYDAAFSTNDRTRAFLKIQDGCDYYCSYCTVPLARGKSRNEGIEEVLKHASSIASKGIEEIILTGVNIGDFGKSTDENFLELILALDKLPDIKRFRISSIEPNLLSDEIILFVQQSVKFVPHFHIPLQSGCDKILSLMNRRYNSKLFASRVNRIKSLIPYACIGSDVIVGFPGETEEDFSTTYSFLDSLEVNYLHVFPYSERPNTKSVSLKDQVKSDEKAKRSRLLLDMSESKKRRFYDSNEGRMENVIFESKNKEGKMFGFTSNYIKVETRYNKELIGQLMKVKLTSVNSKGNFEINF